MSLPVTTSIDDDVLISLGRTVAELQGSLDPPARPGEPPCMYTWRLKTGELIPCQSGRTWRVAIAGRVEPVEVCLTHFEYLARYTLVMYSMRIKEPSPVSRWLAKLRRVVGGGG